jgi:hypothetical protein
MDAKYLTVEFFSRIFQNIYDGMLAASDPLHYSLPVYTYRTVISNLIQCFPYVKKSDWYTLRHIILKIDERYGRYAALKEKMREYDIELRNEPLSYSSLFS